MATPPIRILGIDPGLRRTGWGVIEIAGNTLTFVASGQLGYNDLADKANPRGAFVLANTWMDGTLGALVSVAYTKRETKDIGTSTVRWATGNAFAPPRRLQLSVGVSFR